MIDPSGWHHCNNRLRPQVSLDSRNIYISLYIVNKNVRCAKANGTVDAMVDLETVILIFSNNWMEKNEREVRVAAG